MSSSYRSHGTRRIGDYFEHDDPDCLACHGDGIVCEDHPTVAWGKCCGAMGMPCPGARP